MDRRTFLLALAAGTLAGVTACDPSPTADGNSASRAVPEGTSGSPPAYPPSTTLSATAAPSIASPSVAPPLATTSPEPSVPEAPVPSPTPYVAKVGSPPPSISALPGKDNTVALTIDDGTSSAVVGAYLDFITAANLRLTFFVNGVRSSWTEHAARLRPLVESGQVQLGNHTWSHPNITKLSDAELAAELTRNEIFLANTFGVTARPFFRPPYGFHNARTDRLCADLGLSTIVMWYGSFGDSAILTEAKLLSLATRWLTAHRIVIGHANHPAVTKVYPQILELLQQRHLKTVTLDDAFYGAKGRNKLPS